MVFYDRQVHTGIIGSNFIQITTLTAYHSGRWTENKEFQITSTAFLQRNGIVTAILNA